MDEVRMRQVWRQAHTGRWVEVLTRYSGPGDRRWVIAMAWHPLIWRGDEELRVLESRDWARGAFGAHQRW